MFCRNCGREIKEGNKFCGGCGAPVEIKVKQEERETVFLDDSRPGEEVFANIQPEEDETVFLDIQPEEKETIFENTDFSRREKSVCAKQITENREWFVPDSHYVTQEPQKAKMGGKILFRFLVVLAVVLTMLIIASVVYLFIL